MKATRRPHLRFRLCLLVAPFVCCGPGCDGESIEPVEARNYSFSGYGYWGKDLDYLFEEYKTNPCVENKVAALRSIAYIHLHHDGSEELRSQSLDILYDAAVHARDNWVNEPIESCDQPPRQHVVTNMLEAGVTLDAAMQDQVFFNLKSSAQYSEGHPSIPEKAKDLLYKLEPEDKTSWLYSRWKKRVEQLESQ